MTRAYYATRPTVRGRGGMVTSGHPLASMAGAKMLLAGGNAIDAAIAANAVLNVVRPHMCGIGGDAFMIIWREKTSELKVLNASGRSPAKATIEYFEKKGIKVIPSRGLLPVTVPCTVEGWDRALKKYGTMSLADVLQPAIEYAEGGFPMYEKLAEFVSSCAEILAGDPNTERIFLAQGRSPKPGQLFLQKGLGATFKKIAKGGRDEFYLGETGKKIAKYCQENGGLLTEEDLRGCSSTWTDPITTAYRGYTVCEIPPNSQGIALLLQLNIAENFDLHTMEHNSADFIHLLIEIKKLAFADRDRYVTDPDFFDIPTAALLAKEYARKQAARINMRKAALEVESKLQIAPKGDTTYIAAADSKGNAISLINSIYHDWGSGVVAGDTGILLQNRGVDFSLDRRHHNRLEPRKRCFHTLNPCMILKDGKPIIVLGSPGGHGQTQTLTQVITNLIDFGMDIQVAIEVPRWRSDKGNQVIMENRIERLVREELGKRGHAISLVGDWSFACGGAQGIVIDRQSRVLAAGADPRRDAYAIGW